MVEYMDVGTCAAEGLACTAPRGLPCAVVSQRRTGFSFRVSYSLAMAPSINGCTVACMEYASLADR